MREWLTENQTLLWFLSGTGLVIFVGTFIAIPFLIIRIPADYFVRKPITEWPTSRPALHLTLVILKNVLGVILLLAGIAMLVLPGPGLITIFISIILMDFPGKRRLERWLIRRKPIRNTANWMRARRGHPPLQLPE